MLCANGFPRRFSGRLSALSLLLVIAACGRLSAGEFKAAVESIVVDDLKKHATALSSDTFEGREAGARGGKAAGTYLVEELEKLDLKPAGERNGYYQPFGNDYRNILALVPGSDEELRNEYVLVCAHYDHVGYGSPRNSYGPFGFVHNGADDNASGTAALLEMAQAAASLDEKPKRSLLFVFWDAEEKGLLGSEHWLRSPTVPPKRVRLLVNLDMVGRLRDDTLTIYGVRTAQGLRRLVSRQNDHRDLYLDFNWDIIRDSDHYPFVTNSRPYLMMYTRKHSDYHRPSDDVDKLNFPGMEQIARLTFSVAHAAADDEELGEFRPHCRREKEELHRLYEQPMPNLKPRFGLAWDEKPAQAGAVIVNKIVAGSAADRAGLRVGDRIVEFGGRRPEEFDDFRTLVLTAHNPVPVVVEREGIDEPAPLTVELDGHPLRVGIAWRADNAAPDTVILARVVPGSPADLAGLKVADRVHSVGGESFGSVEEFRELVSNPANPLVIEYERRGQVHTARLKLVSSEPTGRTESEKPSRLE